MKIKVHFEMSKPYRIKRYNGRDIFQRFFYDEEGKYLHQHTKENTYQVFNKNGTSVFVKKAWEDERLRNGEIALYVSSCEEDDNWSSAKSLKAIVRKLRKYAKYLEEGTVFEMFTWVGRGVTFTIKDNPINLVSLKEEIYSGLEIANTYKGLADASNLTNLPFNNLVIALRNEGYFVSVQEVIEDDWSKKHHESDPDWNWVNFWAANVVGKGIAAAFVTGGSDHCNRYLDEKIAADYEPYFDKYSRCALNKPIPKTHEELIKLIKELKDLSNGIHEKYN